jgi:regulator of sigma E protease
VRVLTFSLGFGPKIFKFKRGDTEYCISIIPLGGYVKMAGETVADDREGAPDEFLSKSKWIRFQVYLAGPAMNVLLAIVALTVVLANDALVPKHLDAPAVVGSVIGGSVAEQAGIQAGDLVLRVQGHAVPTWEQFQMAIVSQGGRQIELTLDRHGERKTLTMVPTAEGKYQIGKIGVYPVMRPQISLVVPGSPAERAGIQRDDVLLGIGGQRGLSKESAIAAIRKNGPSPVVFEMERGGKPIEITVTPDGPVGTSEVGLGIEPVEFQHVDPSLGQAFVMSLQKNWDDTKFIGRTLKGLITRETPVNQLLGPLSIADLSGTAAAMGILALLTLMATISLNLALLNLMPIPVLDGGQIAILALEGLFRRDLSIKAKERFAMVGAALILVLMVAVIYNDIARVLR